MDYKRIDELDDIINRANYEYYVLDNPSLTDQEYDAYFNELIDLEKNYLLYVKSNSPTNGVGYDPLGSNKIRHSVPMLGLSDVFCFDDIKKFDKSIGFKEYVCELKIDGISASLTYENGNLVSASTRGNGLVGEDILDSVKLIKDIPLILNIPVSCCVRGEIYMDKKSFDECNAWRKSRGEALFSSARNGTSGCVRSSCARVKKWLSSFMYTLVNYRDFGFNFHNDVLSFLKDLGFCVNSFNKCVNGIDNVISYVNYFCDMRCSLLYDIDGIVIKVNNLSEQELLGNTNRYPKWAIAYKFLSSFVYTRLNDIVLSVGKSGKITPIGCFDPVILDNFCVKRASLYNCDFVINRDIRIGDIVRVSLTGDVIPRIDYVLMDRRVGNEEVFDRVNYPICGSSLIKKDNDLYCINRDCPARCIDALVHFASRDSMNLYGLGDDFIEYFYNLGFLKDISDFYCLYKHYDSIVNMGFDSRKLDKILQGIENSKKNSLEHFIYGLGIKRVGIRNAGILAKRFKCIESLMNASIFDLANIRDIGNVIARNVFYFFRDSNNIDIINRCISYGVNMNYIGDIVIKIDIFYGKNFVLTGSFDISRDSMIDIISSYGGKVLFAITSNTDVLVCGKDPGLKLDSAIKNDIVMG